MFSKCRYGTYIQHHEIIWLLFCFIGRSFPWNKKCIMKFHKYPDISVNHRCPLCGQNHRMPSGTGLWTASYLYYSLPYLKIQFINRSRGIFLQKRLFIQHLLISVIQKIEYEFLFGTAKWLDWTADFRYTCI